MLIGRGERTRDSPLERTLVCIQGFPLHARLGLTLPIEQTQPGLW